jgi:hypothetical protein
LRRTVLAMSCYDSMVVLEKGIKVAPYAVVVSPSDGS